MPSNTANACSSQDHDAKLATKLELFTIRACEVFERVHSGKLLLLDGVDLLQDAAVASGLADEVGSDAIQKVLAAAIATAAQERP